MAQSAKNYRSCLPRFSCFLSVEEAAELEEERGILPEVSSILALHPHRAISSQEAWGRTLRQWVASTDNLLVRAVCFQSFFDHVTSQT
jgi:hypothetical protein